MRVCPLLQDDELDSLAWEALCSIFTLMTPTCELSDVSTGSIKMVDRTHQSFLAKQSELNLN